MNNKNRETLRAVFSEPPSPSIPWRDIESLFRALGADVKEGRGSRVRVVLNGVHATFHEPHPGNQTPRGQVRAARDFLFQAGIEP